MFVIAPKTEVRITSLHVVTNIPYWHMFIINQITFWSCYGFGLIQVEAGDPGDGMGIEFYPLISECERVFVFRLVAY